MKTQTLIGAIAVSCVLLIASCAPRIPFTQAIRNRYDLKENELKSIQFYTSGDIVLSRGEELAKEKGTEEGTLIVKSGKEIDQVVIRSGTPGVVEKVIDENKLAVSFESDDSFLVFGDANNKNERYTLLAAEWKENRGKLKYGKEVYYTPVSSANVYLMFKMKKLNKLKKKERVAKGKKL